MTDLLKTLLFPLAAVTKPKESFDGEGNVQESESSTAHSMSYIVHTLLWFLAIGLSWQCTTKEPTLNRVLYAAVAALFSYLYLMYYLVYRVLMAVPCYEGATVFFSSATSALRK
jgi:hypothetical protein